jgi:hypothetical protein
MKNVSIYVSDFDDKKDWLDFLEELDYSENEKEIIQEVELSISSVEVPNSSIEDKLY